MTVGPASRPIFFIGMGRSGSTLIFELFAAHPELAWFSQYLNRWPRFPSLAFLSRLADLSPALRRSPPGSGRTPNRWLEKARVRPAEAYGVWRYYAGEKFLHDALFGARAAAEERERVRALVGQVTRYQGKSRFVAKVTGPPRIEYLSSIFDDAYFVHLVRDGRAVVRSLMNVPFWRDSFRLREPGWRNALTSDQLEAWQRHGRSPLALAAIEWCAMVAAARREAAALASGRYMEFRYEDFVASPHHALDEMVEFCGLPHGKEMHAYLDRAARVLDMNVKWHDAFGPRDTEVLDELMGETLDEFGYTPRMPSDS